MEFLDEQGVQPCGHNAREKGMIIKVYASCKSNEIPTEYRYSVSGVINNKNTGEMRPKFWTSQLLERQRPVGIDSSVLNCNSNTIDEPCTLKPGSTWLKWRQYSRLYFVRGKNRGKPVWHYVLVIDDDETEQKFNAKLASERLDVADYGQILASGWGKDPPNHVKDRITEEYSISYNHGAFKPK